MENEVSTRSWVLLASLGLAVCIRYQIPENNKETKADSKDGMYKAYSRHTIITFLPLSTVFANKKAVYNKSLLASLR